MRKRWLFVPLVVGLMFIGVTGGAVLAQDSGGEGDGADAESPRATFASRVASILGLEAATVQDAFQQAKSELKDETIQRKLDRQVEQGRITREQADEYLEWYRSRPEGLDRAIGPRGSAHRGGFGRRGGGRSHGMFHRGFSSAAPVAPTPEGVSF